PVQVTRDLGENCLAREDVTVEISTNWVNGEGSTIGCIVETVRDFVDISEAETCFFKTIGDGTDGESTSVFFPVEALFGGGGEQFPINKKRRCRVMPLRDTVFAIVETRPMTLLKRDRTFKATDSYDLHGP